MENLWRLVLATVAASAAATAAHAQEAPFPAATPAGASTGADAGEIVVTAQKRSERLQNVPIAVTAISGDRLRTLGIRAADDLVSSVPNLQLSATIGEGTPIFALRGVSMSDFSLNQSGPVATYYDEVYKGNFALLGVALYDLERVEVLRGPQGTLYGKNTTGGAVNLISKVPTFDTEGYFTLGYGNYNRFEASGAVQTPIGDKLAVRLAFTATGADGWFKNRLPGHADLDGTREIGVRASVLFKPSDLVDFVLRVSGSFADPNNYGINAQPGPQGIGAGLYQAAGQSGYFRAGLNNREIQSDYTPRRRQLDEAVSLTTNVHLPKHLTVTSITSWDYGDLFVPEDTDGSPLKALEIPYFDKAKQFSEDLRLTSDFGGAFNFILGGYYNQEDVFNSTNNRYFQDLDVNGDGVLNSLDCLAGFPIGCQLKNSFDQHKESGAIYSDVRLRIARGLTVRGGLRYTRDTGQLSNFISQAFGSDGTLLTNQIPGSTTDLFATTSAHYATNDVSGKIGLDWKLSSGTLLYASFSRGYRARSFNAQAFFSPEELTIARPESVLAYEGGVKATAFDRKLQGSASFFGYDYTDQQFINVNPINNIQTLINVPKSRILGGEIEFSARPINRVRLNGGAGFLDTKILRGTLQGVNLHGKELSNSPHLNGNFGLDVDALVGDRGTLTVHSDVAYTSSQYFEVLNEPQLKQPGYALVNARLTYQPPHGRWEAALWAKNLFDRYYFTSRIDVSGFGWLYNHVGAPRTFGASASYRF